MTILIKPGQAVGPGNSQPLPLALRSAVLPGACWYYYQADFGSLLWQELRQLTYPLYFFCFMLKRPATFLFSCPAPVTALQATLEGGITGIMDMESDGTTATASIGLLYLPAGLHRVSLPEGITDTFQVELDVKDVTELLEGWHRQQELLDRMQGAGEEGLLFPRIPLNYQMRESLEGIKRGTGKGPGQKLNLRSRVGDLLNYYLAGMEEISRLEQLTEQPYKAILLKLWLDIKADPSIKKFTLHRVAAEYYLHRNTLDRSFQKLFQITLHDHVEQECMKKAEHLLLNTRQDLDDISDSLGYSNRSSFRRAFLRVMHCQPESLRE